MNGRQSRVNDSFWLTLLPRRLRFESQLAVRHLRSGGKQTLLTISAVAAGVIIVVFVTALIFGLQRRWTNILTDALPHITIRVVDPKPTPLAAVPGLPFGAVSSRIEQRAPQEKNIENWAQVVEVVHTLPNVRVVAPVVRGQAFASKGGNPYGVAVIGADPEIQDQVTPVTKNLVAGRYLGLDSEEIVIDYELARDLNVSTGDRIRLTSSTGAVEAFTIAGIYSQGQGRGSAYITLRTAQSLYGMGTAVNAILVKVVDIFRANEAAARLQALLPYEARSWIQEFPQFLSSLQMQTASAYLISAFSLVASAFAIASILIVSVLQKSKQIGILKSMGARRSQILRAFVLEGLGIALVGSSAGAAVGMSIVYLLSLIEQPITRVGQPPEQLFPVAILPLYIALAMLAATAATVLAALLPARRAARLNPVDVIR
ncbi:MAG: ABC transporter permease [Candidatus Entotheonellia bacterium]